MRTSRTYRIAAAFAAAAVTVTMGCTSPFSELRWQSEPDIDPKSYFTEYGQEQDSESAQRSAGGSATSEAAKPAPDAAPPWYPGTTEANTFDDVGETGFVPASVDELSTFALDVDTGSYRIAQLFADSGYQPPADSIRSEEWINAFDYGDEAPTSDDLAIGVESGVVPHATDGTRLVRIGIASKQLSPEERPRANVTFVIDTSGSMDIRERLGLVKASLALLAANLRADDTISIVTYGDDADVLLEPTPVGDSDPIVDAIESLRPGGSTNMEAGLRRGYEQARKAYVEDAVNVVVLASDGVANVGVSDSQGLTGLIAEEGRKGISLVTVGFGMGNYNDELMEQLANDGDGFYAYIDTYEEAKRLFVDDLTPTLTVVARDAKSQVRFDPEVVESYRLIGYENRAIADEDFRDDTVDAGEVGAGHNVTALYEVRLHDPGAADVEIGAVTLRWESVGSGELADRSVPIMLGGPDSENSSSLDLAATVAYSAEVLRENAVVRGRQLTLTRLIDDAARLADAGVRGADELEAYLTTVEPLPKADAVD